jgi:hypothetical protein
MKKLAYLIIALVLALGLALPLAAPVLADNTGFKFPTSYATGTTGEPPAYPEKAFVDDVATGERDYTHTKIVEFKQGGGISELYYGFGLGIPSGAAIDGIEVVVSGYSDGAEGSNEILTFGIGLSGDTGVSWTGYQETPRLVPQDAEYTLGGPADLWGKAWNAGSFSDGNFRLEVVASHSGHGDYVALDSVRVKVYYHAVNAPTITSIDANQGTQGQTLPVVVTGANFTGATAVSLGAGITVNSFTVTSDTQITASITIAPLAALGTRNLSITTAAGTTTLNNCFTVKPAGQSSASANTSLGTVNFTTSAGYISGLVNVPRGSMTCSASDFIFPYGMFGFNITNLIAGQQVVVAIRFPNPLPLNVKYFKCRNGSPVDCSSVMTRPDPYTIILNLTDGGLGDADGVANGTIVDPGGPAFRLNTTPQSSSAQMPVTAPQKPVSLSNIAVQSAKLSTSKVAPEATVTITANVANTGTANGSTLIKLYVNGQEESSQGITVNSGSTNMITFTVSRNEPGTYNVYVGGTQAGAFTVEQFADPNIILYISVTLILLAFAIGVIYIIRERQPGC